MANHFKGIVGQFIRSAVTFIQHVRKELRTVHHPSTLITGQSNPELIQAVTEELKRQNAFMILGKLQDLEKAVYHLASRQKEFAERQEMLEQHVVAIHTTVEEMLHGMEIVIEQAEESDMEAWDSKKGTPTLN